MQQAPEQDPGQEPERETTAQRILNASERLLLTTGRLMERFVPGLPVNELWQSSISLFNPLAVQANLLGVGYGKKPLEKRRIAVPLATVLSFVPQAAVVALMFMPIFFPSLLVATTAVTATAATAAAVMGPADIAMMSTMFTFMGSCMAFALHKEIFRKKLETRMEEVNAAGQRVSGSREDLCALALRQKLVSRISKRFNAHAAPRAAVRVTDLLIHLTKSRRARVAVLDAGEKGAGLQTYEFAGAIDTKSQMMVMAEHMTNGAVKDVKVMKPLRLKGSQPKAPS